MKDKELRLPKAVYYQCLWTVKDMERLKRLEAAEAYAADEGELVFFVDEDEVIKSAAVLEEAGWRLDCIRKAIRKLPEEYRQYTMESIIYNIPFNDLAHENTWRKWRQVFLRELAKNLMLI